TATVTCSYTGGAQSWTPPAGVTSAKFDVYGGQGGSAGATSSAAFRAGGKGAHVTTTLTVTPGQALQITVGGAAHNANSDGGDGSSKGLELGGGGGGGGLYGGGGGGGAQGFKGTAAAGGGGGGGGSNKADGGTLANGARVGNGLVVITYTLTKFTVEETALS